MEVRGRKLELLIPEDKIQEKVKELAKAISREFNGEELYVIGILKGSFMFFADLVRNLEGKIFIEPFKIPIT